MTSIVKLIRPLVAPTRHCLKMGRLARFSTSTVSMDRMDISGIYPPIATPFNEDETIAYDKLKTNMDIWNGIPFRGMSLFSRFWTIPLLNASATQSSASTAPTKY